MSQRLTVLGMDKLNFEKLKCLFVDDNMQSLDILGTICAGFGIRDTTKCQSADEARAVLQKTTYDFVMTDAQMPGTNGYELVTWIRREASEANRFIPVIVVTGHTRISQILRARDCGAPPWPSRSRQRPCLTASTGSPTRTDRSSSARPIAVPIAVSNAKVRPLTWTVAGVTT